MTSHDQPGAPGPGWGPPAGGPPDAGPPAFGAPPGSCYVHPGRTAGATCRRCGRPICPDCMREAPVGWQCPVCIHLDAKQAPVTRWKPRRAGTLGATRMTPVVIGLIALNAVVYLLETTDSSLIPRFANIPFEDRHEPYRLLTAAFLHANFTHILFNMITLAVIGPALEAAVGRSRFVAIYLLAGIGGDVLSFLVGPLFEESLGASGAIFGVIGAYFVVARLRGWDVSLVAPLLVINLVYSFIDPAIDWRAHIGGLVVGAGVAYGFHRCERLRGRAGVAAEAAVVVMVLAVLVALSRVAPGHL